MAEDLEELKTLIIHTLDVTDFLDLLNMDISDLVEKFEEEIEENYMLFKKAVR